MSVNFCQHIRSNEGEVILAKGKIQKVVKEWTEYKITLPIHS